MNIKKRYTEDQFDEVYKLFEQEHVKSILCDKTVEDEVYDYFRNEDILERLFGVNYLPTYALRMGNAWEVYREWDKDYVIREIISETEDVFEEDCIEFLGECHLFHLMNFYETPY